MLSRERKYTVTMKLMKSREVSRITLVMSQKGFMNPSETFRFNLRVVKAKV